MTFSNKIINKKVINGGHVWFPKYESVKKLIDDSPFEEYKFFHYYDESFHPVINKIDYMKGYVYRRHPPLTLLLSLAAIS